MTDSAENLTIETTLDIFRVLNDAGVTYAVLRDYDAFPDFNHNIHLVVSVADLVQFRQIVMDIARTREWHALVECNHWGGSRFAYQNLEVFRFYNPTIDYFLQLNVTHGLIFSHVPLFDDSEMLAGREEDPRGFYRIGTDVEHMLLILKMHALLAEKGHEELVDQIRRRIVNYNLKRDGGFQAFLENKFRSLAAPLLDVLQMKNYTEFSFFIKEMKKQYRKRYFLSHPFSAALYLIARGWYFFRTYFLNPCGFILWAHAPDEKDKTLLIETLELMVSKNVLHSFTTERASHHDVNWDERKILERGGLVVKWSRRRNRKGVLNVTRTNASSELSASMQRILINQCRGLYLKEKRKRR